MSRALRPPHSAWGGGRGPFQELPGTQQLSSPHSGEGGARLQGPEAKRGRQGEKRKRNRAAPAQRFRRPVTGSDWFRRAVTGSDWFRRPVTSSDWFRRVVTGSEDQPLLKSPGPWDPQLLPHSHQGPEMCVHLNSCQPSPERAVRTEPAVTMVVRGAKSGGGGEEPGGRGMPRSRTNQLPSEQSNWNGHGRPSR